MIKNNSNYISIHLEEIDKHVAQCKNLIEKFEYKEKIDCTDNNWSSIELNQLKNYVSELEILLVDLKKSNIKNNSITELYRTD